MSTTFRSQMKEVMILAWQMVKKNGFTMSEALKVSWANLKLKAALKVKVVEFYFVTSSLWHSQRKFNR